VREKQNLQNLIPNPMWSLFCPTIREMPMPATNDLRQLSLLRQSTNWLPMELFSPMDMPVPMFVRQHGQVCLQGDTNSDLDFIMDFNPQLIECSLELVNPQIIQFCKTNQLKIMVNALQKESYKNYQKIIDSEADMVNLDYPDKMIDLIK
jgi:hypothetical protein